MSYLSFVLTKDYCITTSDGLLLSYNSKNEVQDSFNEFPKFMNVSKRQMMGVSFFGNTLLYENLIQLVNKKIGNPKNNSFENGKSVDLKQLAYTIKTYLDDNSNDLRCHIVLIGFNKFNLPEMYIIHTDETTITSVLLVQDDMVYYPMVSYKSEIKYEELVNRWTIKMKQNKNADMKSTLNYLEELSSLVNENDLTVNDKFYWGIVFRKKNLKEFLKETMNLLKDKFK